MTWVRVRVMSLCFKRGFCFRIIVGIEIKT